MKIKQQTIIALIIGTMFAGAVFAAPYSPDAYTIALYHFDESAGSGLPQDSSFYTNNATSGPQATGDTGKFGNAMAFTNTLISIPDDPSFDNAQTNGTIEFWIKPDATSINQWGGDKALVKKDAGGSHAGDFTVGYRMNPIANGGGSFYLSMDTDTAQRLLRSSGVITAVQWYHVVVSWDSATKPRLTVDDSSLSWTDVGSDSSYVGPIFGSSDPLSVGALNGASGGYFLLDEFRITFPEPPDTNRPAITYVVPQGTAGVTPTPFYTNWVSAATNIQDAIDAVGDNGTVLVSNGTYTLSATLEITRGITLRSYNNGSVDRAGTIIDGDYPTASNRCVYLSGVGVVIDGFTITNGYTTAASLSGNGGGVYIDQNGTVTNCLITGNEAEGGGGIYLNQGGLVAASTISGNVATTVNTNSYGGGMYFNKGGLVTNCLVSGNIANRGAGVWLQGVGTTGGLLIDSTVANNKAFVYSTGQGAAGIGTYFKGVVDNCSIVSNTIVTFSGSGYNAGVQLSYYCILRNSLIAYNTGGNYGGGVQVGNQGTASNCVIRNNSSNTGGGVYLGNFGLLQDCIVVSNSAAVFCQGGTARNCLFADNNSGIWVQSGATPSKWQNCTIVNHPGHGIRFSVSAMVENTIVYENNSGGDNWLYDGTGSGTTWTNSCTLPLPTGSSDIGNISNAPLFVDSSAGDYHLRRSSPCVNAGVDRDWMTGAVDLDGEPRLINAVDMGVYELPLPRGMLIILQ